MHSIHTIRQTWLDYHSGLGYEKIPSAPLVHPSFPMSFNMSAGLVQLDPIIRQSTPAKASKKCLVQKCFRHFDLDKIGDTTHLTFFEMPGAFEIVDLDEIATVYTLWNFLTQTLGIDPSKIWITCFNQDKFGDSTIKMDKQVIRELRTLVGNRLILGDSTTNLWKQGGGIDFSDSQRLCGPQVEFFFDLGTASNQQNPLTNQEHFLEIGNIIFIKYTLDFANNRINNLVNPSTESVIGLERVVAVLENGGNDVYNTSAFLTFRSILPPQIKPRSANLIMNHAKSLYFILSEELIEPGKNGRQRIIRTLIRQLLAAVYLADLDPHLLLPPLFCSIQQLYAATYSLSDCKPILELIYRHESIYQKTLKSASAYFTRARAKNLPQATITHILANKYGIFPDTMPLIDKEHKYAQ